MRKASRPTVKIHVKLVGFLALVTGRPEMDVNVEAGSTVADFINVLANSLGANFPKAILDPEGNLNGEVALILNQHHISLRKIHETAIREDSDLVIIPLMDGG